VEAAILRGLADSDAVMTLIVVAYRRATIALADEIVYIEGGRVLDRGSHEELMEREPGYVGLITAYERDAESAEASDDKDVLGDSGLLDAGVEKMMREPIA